MVYDPAKYPDRICAIHNEPMIVRPNGHAQGRQQYRQFCGSCFADSNRLKHQSESRRAYLKRRRDAAGGSAALTKRWKAENPEKYLAHKAVEYAVKAGKLICQPCERCGTTKLVHAHHEDYSKQLEVNWLCSLHHNQRHAELALGSTEQALPNLGRAAAKNGAASFFKTQNITPYTN